jgi:hypothetical protein
MRQKPLRANIIKFTLMRAVKINHHGLTFHASTALRQAITPAMRSTSLSRIPHISLRHIHILCFLLLPFSASCVVALAYRRGLVPEEFVIQKRYCHQGQSSGCHGPRHHRDGQTLE